MMKRRRKSRRTPRLSPGAPPGTIAAHPDAHPSTVRVMAYGPDDFEEYEGVGAEELQDILARWPVTWINVDGLADTNLIERLGRRFGLHRLALEDVVNVGQRAKVDLYDDQTFVVSRMVTLDEQVETEQISLFIGSNYVLSFQEKSGDCFDQVRNRIRTGRKVMRSSGPDYLAYALLDALIDSYFPVVEAIGEGLERLEDDVVARPDAGTVGRIQARKSQLLTLRRAIWPHRDALNGLVRGEEGLLSPETRLHMRDVYDHTVQILDLVESYRETTSDLMSIYLSVISNRMNEVMKLLTVIATIFIPLGFVAGLYGMNFDPEASPWNMPELGWYWGYPAALGIMAAVVIVMLAYFRRKRLI